MRPPVGAALRRHVLAAQGGSAPPRVPHAPDTFAENFRKMLLQENFSKGIDNPCVNCYYNKALLIRSAVGAIICGTKSVETERAALMLV